MCELLGFSAKTPMELDSYLKVFYSHSVRHPHGWGLMREKNEKTEIIKEPMCASGSRILSEVIKKTGRQKNLMAHIRLATVGSVKSANCHPYTGFDSSGRRWTLIHNGTIYSGTSLAKYLSEQTGDTDSERVFLCILDEIDKEIIRNDAPLDAQRRFHVIEQTVTKLAPRNKLNLMIFDGEVLYVHKNMKDTLVYKRLGDGIIISTTPLDNDDWTPFPMTQVHAFMLGECIFKGAVHGYEFVPTLEYITALDAMNI